MGDDVVGEHVGMVSEDMVCVFSSGDYYAAQFARGALEAAGLRPTVVGETLRHGTFGGAPLPESEVRIFVPAAQEAEARQVLAEMDQAPEVEPESWFCVHCGTEVDGVFDRCWKCGREDGRG